MNLRKHFTGFFTNQRESHKKARPKIRVQKYTESLFCYTELQINVFWCQGGNSKITDFKIAF